MTLTGGARKEKIPYRLLIAGGATASGFFLLHFKNE